MKTFKLHLIRHGLTSGNLQGLYIGSGTDIPLCDEGRAQLAELKERFEYPQVDTVFSSPLMRAVETSNILFPNATHQFSVHDLREAGFGVFENHPVKELVKNEDFKKWITPGSGFVPEGAEPTEQFHARCSETLLKLFEYMIRMDVTEAACVSVVLTSLGALFCGVFKDITAFDPMLILMVPLTIVAVFANITAFARVRHCYKVMTANEKKND